jgi:predicted Zn-dependent protease
MSLSSRDTPTPATPPRILSEAECQQLAKRVMQFGQRDKESYTIVGVRSDWKGYLRWARNRATAMGDVCNTFISLGRNIHGAGNPTVMINDTDDATLYAAVQRAERLAELSAEQPQTDLIGARPPEAIPSVSLFSNATFNLDQTLRAAAARGVAQAAHQAGMLSAGYLEVGARAQALVDSLGRAHYMAYTTAQYSVTTRDPQGTGSGWAGDSSHDWTAIDAAALSARALEKCLASRHPVTLEPGRYTTILEPQAVSDFVSPMVLYFDRMLNASSPPGPFQKNSQAHGMWLNKLGERVIDPRLTITADPADPVVGFPSFDVGAPDGRGDAFGNLAVYHPATWVERGVLTQLGYFRYYGIDHLGVDTGRPNSGSFRMTGGTTSMDEMIATTKRGLVVTRFDRLQLLNVTSLLQRGYTRDGIWLIEDGKISKPVKNFAFTESPLFALNNVEQLGVPQRVFRPSLFDLQLPTPAVVPPLKIGDFSFTSLSDAV